MTYRKETGDTIVQSLCILNVNGSGQQCRCLPESPHASFILQDDCDSSCEIEVLRAKHAFRKALPVYCKCGRTLPIMAYYDQSSSLRTISMISYFRAILSLVFIQRRPVGGFFLGLRWRSRRHFPAESIAGGSLLLLRQ